mgnify:FL=1
MDKEETRFPEKEKIICKYEFYLYIHICSRTWLNYSRECLKGLKFFQSWNYGKGTKGQWLSKLFIYSHELNHIFATTCFMSRDLKRCSKRASY